MFALRKRQLRTFDVCSRVRLTKTPEEYAAARALRQELPYEALLTNGYEHWSVGERIYVYRRSLGRAGLLRSSDDPDADESSALDPAADARDYDVEHYVRQLRVSFASRLERGVMPEDFEAIVADPDRPLLFSRSLENAAPILSVREDGDVS